MQGLQLYINEQLNVNEELFLDENRLTDFLSNAWNKVRESDILRSGGVVLAKITYPIVISKFPAFENVEYEEYEALLLDLLGLAKKERVLADGGRRGYDDERMYESVEDIKNFIQTRFRQFCQFVSQSVKPRFKEIVKNNYKPFAKMAYATLVASYPILVIIPISAFEDFVGWLINLSFMFPDVFGLLAQNV